MGGVLALVISHNPASCLHPTKLFSICTAGQTQGLTGKAEALPPGHIPLSRVLVLWGHLYQQPQTEALGGGSGTFLHVSECTEHVWYVGQEGLVTP